MRGLLTRTPGHLPIFQVCSSPSIVSEIADLFLCIFGEWAEQVTLLTRLFTSVAATGCITVGVGGEIGVKQVPSCRPKPGQLVK